MRARPTLRSTDALLVIADTGAEIADFRHEARLGARFGSTRLREHVVHFVDVAILGRFDLKGMRLIWLGFFRDSRRAATSMAKTSELNTVGRKNTKSACPLCWPIWFIVR
jgi:hypothetical protein